MSSAELLRAQSKEYVDLQKLRLSMYFTSVRNYKMSPRNQTPKRNSPAVEFSMSPQKESLPAVKLAQKTREKSQIEKKSSVSSARTKTTPELGSHFQFKKPNAQSKSPKKGVENKVKRKLKMSVEEQETYVKSKKKHVNKSVRLEEEVDERLGESSMHDQGLDKTESHKLDKRVKRSSCESWAQPYQEIVSGIVSSLSAPIIVKNDPRFKLPEKVFADTLQEVNRLQAKRVATSGISELARHLLYTHDDEISSQAHTSNFWKRAKTDSNVSLPTECPVQLSANKQQHTEYCTLLEKIEERKEKRKGLITRLQKARQLKELTSLIRETAAKMSPKDLVKNQTIQNTEQAVNDLTELLDDLRK